MLLAPGPAPGPAPVPVPEPSASACASACGASAEIAGADGAGASSVLVIGDGARLDASDASGPAASTRGAATKAGDFRIRSSCVAASGAGASPSGTAGLDRHVSRHFKIS